VTVLCLCAVSVCCIAAMLIGVRENPPKHFRRLSFFGIFLVVVSELGLQADAAARRTYYGTHIKTGCGNFDITRFGAISHAFLTHFSAPCCSVTGVSERPIKRRNHQTFPPTKTISGHRHRGRDYRSKEGITTPFPLQTLSLVLDVWHPRA